MPYEWDESKRISNQEKHDVDFEEMEDFDWDTALIIPMAGYDESRSIAIGSIGARLHTVVFTERGENTRIISLRKASRRESRDYNVQRQTGNHLSDP